MLWVSRNHSFIGIHGPVGWLDSRHFHRPNVAPWSVSWLLVANVARESSHYREVLLHFINPEQLPVPPKSSTFICYMETKIALHSSSSQLKFRWQIITGWEGTYALTSCRIISYLIVMLSWYQPIISIPDCLVMVLKASVIFLKGAPTKGRFVHFCMVNATTSGWFTNG